MSGHSKFANIKHKKEKNDAAKGKIFTIIGREIAVAVKEGGSADPANNSQVCVMLSQRQKLTICQMTRLTEVLRKQPEMAEVSQITNIVTYEGYGPNGTAIIVDDTYR